MFDTAVRDTLAEFEATGSPVVTDGEQRKFQSFWTYSIHGLPDLDAHGFEIPFNVGHIRFAPFSDDRSTSRATAFAKIRARVQGTAMAAAHLGISDS